MRVDRIPRGARPFGGWPPGASVPARILLAWILVAGVPEARAARPGPRVGDDGHPATRAPRFPAPGHLGVVFTVREAEIPAPEEARVERILVRLGDGVEQGDVIVILESRNLRDALSRARMGLEAAAAESLEASVSLLEAVRMHDRREAAPELQSREALEAARAARARAEAALQAARARVQEQAALVTELRDRVAALEVVSPLDGAVARVLVQQGQWTTAGTPLIEVLDPTSSWVRFAVPAGESDAFSPGTRVEAVIEGDRSAIVEVRQVSPEIDSATGMLFMEGVILEASCTGPLPRPGSICRVQSPPTANDLPGDPR